MIARFSPKLININLYFWEVKNTLKQPKVNQVHLACLTHRTWQISSGYNLKDCGGSDQRQCCLYTEDVTGATLMDPTVVANRVVSSFLGASMAAGILCVGWIH